MADGTFYVRNRGKISGPYDTAGLQKLVRRGLLSRVQEISQDRATWNRAGDYEDLFPTPAALMAVGAEHEVASSYEQSDQAGADDSGIAAQAISERIPANGSNYYYARNGVAVGPVAVSILTMLAQTGTLGADDLVWREGDSSGIPARQVPALAPMYSTIVHYATPRATSDKYAGFWRRFGAWVVDTIIVVIVTVAAGMGLGFIIGALMASANAQGRDIYTAGQLVGNILGFLIPWFYFAFFESSTKRATPGKMALGIEVVSDRGEQISFGRATGRYFGKIVSALILYFGFFMAGWTERKQALHDMMAGCLVVNK
jgi:uncharacterized RDD family membrane protein YckC